MVIEHNIALNLNALYHYNCTLGIYVIVGIILSVRNIFAYYVYFDVHGGFGGYPIEYLWIFVPILRHHTMG